MNQSNYSLIKKLYDVEITDTYLSENITTHEKCEIKKLSEKYPLQEHIAALKYEYDILKDLNIDNVIKVYDIIHLDNIPALVLESVEGKPLNYWVKQFKIELKDSISIITKVAKALLELHRTNIIHKDVCPQNIIWNPKTGVVKLINFGGASKLHEEKLEITKLDNFRGTIAYISPEQTGRINRGLDYRSDIYSLGITFYEILTGERPYKTDDAMEMMHAHIAMTAVSPSEIYHDIPVMVSKIVMKCMEKNAEDRYQSDYGIIHDLNHCHDELEMKKTVSEFKLASKDYLDRLNITGKLYGRDEEITQLIETFNKASEGRSECILLAGHSDVGKTALAYEMRNYVAEKNGYFITGKCDQMHKAIPYNPLIQTIRQLVRNILAGSEKEITQWKERITQAIGSNGQLIIDIIPSLANVIGPQPVVETVSPDQGRVRFERTMINFLKSLVTQEQPLVILIDDLQWVDFS